MDKIELLKDYVGNANPQLNIELRKGLVSQNVLEFDKLFEVGAIPAVLYRLTPNEFVHVNNREICDPAHLSCTEDVDKFIDHIEGRHIACMKINIPNPMLRINVCERLPSYNDEGEYILPRNLRLHVEDVKEYEGGIQLEEFLSNVDGFTSADELEKYEK